MAQTQHIARPASVSKQRFDPVLHAAIAEVAQKRIAGAERQETPGSGAHRQGACGIQAIHDFVGSSVAADRDKVPDASPIRLAGNLRRLSRTLRLRDSYLDAASLQALQRRAQQLAAASRLPPPDSQSQDIFAPKFEIQFSSKEYFAATLLNSAAGHNSTIARRFQSTCRFPQPAPVA